MVRNKKLRIILLAIALVAGYYGIMFVTQSGQSGVVIQNDGYAGTGAFLLLVSGFIVGVLADRGNHGKKR